MAPRKLTQIERWIGTEAERLALDASGFSPGSTFFERDTGSMHKWDGTSWGKEIITVADIAGIKTAIESLDNKELATELTLAQILTILGGTAADIGTLKLENGQIKGYDGTDWQPVRVNDAGELILASEVTVNAEGLSVDLGKLVLQAKNPSGVPVDMKSDTEGNLKVSLSGTIATTQGVSDIEIEPGAAVVFATIKSDDFSKFNLSLNGAPGSIFEDAEVLYEATHEAGNYRVSRLVHPDRRIETETVGGTNWRISQDETLRGVESRFKLRNNHSSQVLTLRAWQIRRF